MPTDDEQLWVVLLQGEAGELWGKPTFVRAPDGEAALAGAYPRPPSTRAVLQALVLPIGGPWLQVEAQVPAPEWGKTAEYG